jgi:hypothetical protein
MVVLHQISRNIFKVTCITVYALSITIKCHILTTTLSAYFRTTMHSFNISYSAVNSQKDITDTFNKGLKTSLGWKFKIPRFRQSSFPFMPQQYIHHCSKKQLREKTPHFSRLRIRIVKWNICITPPIYCLIWSRKKYRGCWNIKKIADIELHLQRTT